MNIVNHIYRPSVRWIEPSRFAAFFLSVYGSSSGAHAAAVAGVQFDTGSYEIDNFDGTILSGGSSTVDHDGTVVQIGYYINPLNPSLGWVPLVGEGSANSAFANSTIGDRAALSGGDDGIFEDGWLFTVGSVTTGQSLPPAGKPLRVRFYNATSLALSTAYQEVFNSLWLWQAPADVMPPDSIPLVNMSLADPGAKLLTGDNLPVNGHIRTDQGRVVPEPTTFLMSVAGVLALVGGRRHRW